MDIMTVAYSTMSFLHHVSESRELTKEEVLLRDQCCRTLKEGMRYNELAYQRLIQETEKKV